MNQRNTILIVDDMEINRVILRSIFEKDYNLLEAENGEQAMLLLNQYHAQIAVMLLDLVMPVKDGYQVMGELAAKNFLKEFPVIVITAEGSAENEIKVFDLGASDIVMKPFEPHVIKRRVQNVVELNMRRLHQQELIEEQAEKLRESNAIMVEALSSIIEYRSVETGQHIQRIRLFTKILLENVSHSYPEFDLNVHKIELIMSASSMHDIGKIAIPDSILNKPGRLTKEEFETMKSHTVKGCEMLETLDRMSDKEYLQYAYHICRYHHERWDGKGYPDGLKGDAIPICAQVVGIADCYDALTTDRVYKKAIPPEQAFNMILNGECGTFSPKLLECFKNVQNAFAQLSQEYADGKIHKTTAVKPKKQSLIWNHGAADTLQVGQMKYFSLLRYLDSTVMEADLSTGLYHVVYMSGNDFELLKSGGDFEQSVKNFIKEAVHPEDRGIALEMLGKTLQEFFDNGLMKYSLQYRVYHQAVKQYQWYQVTILRIDTEVPQQRKIMLVWKPQPELMKNEAVEKRMAPLTDDATLSNLIGSVQTYTNDSMLSLLGRNEGIKRLLGYTEKEIHGQFNNQYINFIYPPDRSMVQKEIKRQMKNGNLLETEYRLVTKSGDLIWILDKGQIISQADGKEYILCVLIDITQSKKAQEELRLTLERHKIIMEQTNDIIFEWDIKKDQVIYSSNGSKKLGYPPVEKKFSQKILVASHIHPEDLPQFVQFMEKIVSGMPYEEIEFRLADSKGCYRWYKIRAAAQFNEYGKAFKAIGVLMDIDEEKKKAQLLQFQAQRDELTKLYNKRAGNEQIESLLTQRPQNQTYAMLLIDVDDFKQINDTYGHLFGDAVLQQIAKKLSDIFEPDDVISRIGGDEFLVMMREVADRQFLQEKCQVVLDSFRDILHKHMLKCQPSCSIGISLCPEDGTTFETLFQNSDRALYCAKSKGKNCFTFFDTGMLENSFGIEQLTVNTRIESNEVSDEPIRLLINQVFHKLYQADSLKQAVSSMLQMIGTQFGVSRAYIFEQIGDDEICANTFEWCNQGIEPQIQNFHHYSYEEIGGKERYISLFNEDDVFYCSDIAQMEEEIYQIFSQQEIKSILQCAIREHGIFKGFIGFDDCMIQRLWTKEQIDTLAFMAKLLSTFLLKERAQEQATSMAEDLCRILDHQNAWMYVIDQDTFELQYVNEKARMLVPSIQKGTRCYEAIFDVTKPCETCPVKNGDKDLKKNIERYNSRLKTWEAVDAAPITWKQKKAWLLTCQDITAYKVKSGEENKG